MSSMIRCTFVVVLAILLLIISVSGFFILLISNDCNIFYPYAQSSLQHQTHHLETRVNSISSTAITKDSTKPQPLLYDSSTANESFFYTSTICQLTLILFEVMVALVIIFNNEMACDSAPNYSYNLISSNSRHPPSQSSRYQRKSRLLFTLKLFFVLLISVSFLLRLVTSTWGSILLDVPNQSVSYTSSDKWTSTSYLTKAMDAVITGASNFSGIIYVTTIIEVLLFVLVFSASITTRRISSPPLPAMRMVSRK